MNRHVKPISVRGAEEICPWQGCNTTVLEWVIAYVVGHVEMKGKGDESA